mmetsp:Transcript_63562/g.74442  ORF Transcript_63562/g.74442 Transcript_63562/m.74442 type:complete len:81 (+) Transcript_63562:173-415(+)
MRWFGPTEDWPGSLGLLQSFIFPSDLETILSQEELLLRLLLFVCWWVEDHLMVSIVFTVFETILTYPVICTEFNGKNYIR